MIKKRAGAILAVIAVLICGQMTAGASSLSGFIERNGIEDSGAENGWDQEDTADNHTAQITLQDYDGGFFSLKLPVGWTLETAGSGAGFGFHAYDSSNPDLQIFWYGELGPYFKNYAAKNFYVSYDQMTGVPTMLSYLPVLETPSLQRCLETINDYEDAYYAATGEQHDFPDIYNLSEVRSMPVNETAGQIAVGGEMLMAQLTSKTGTPCIGNFYGQVLDAGSYVMEGIDVSPSRGCLGVTGVIAPKELYDDVWSVLSEAACSIRFTEEYVEQNIEATDELTRAVLERMRENSAVNEILNNNFLDYINDTVTIYYVE